MVFFTSNERLVTQSGTEKKDLLNLSSTHTNL